MGHPRFLCYLRSGNIFALGNRKKTKILWDVQFQHFYGEMARYKQLHFGREWGETICSP